MGLFDLIKNRMTQHKYASMLSGKTPIFRQYNGSVYSYDVVQQALSCIAQEMSKLQPRHLVNEGADMFPATDKSIVTVLKNPNRYMTTSDFIEKAVNILFITHNAFIIPTYEKGKLRELYPINPAEVTFLEDKNGELFIRLRFNNNYETELKYTDVIHIRHHFGLNDLMGGDVNGRPDLEVLEEAVQLNHALLQGVSSAVRSSFAVNGVIKYNTMLDKEKMESNIHELQERLAKNESGFLPMDLKGEFIPINKQIQLVDEKTLEFVDQKILRHFGVSLPILTGDYTTAQKEAFYQKAIEPLVIKFNQAFTKTLFTPEKRAHGNHIAFMTRYLEFMTMDQKIEMARILGDAGDLYENEKRYIFGLDPLEELKGKRMQSLNYVDVDIAKDYQLEGGKNEPVN